MSGGEEMNVHSPILPWSLYGDAVILPSLEGAGSSTSHRGPHDHRHHSLNYPPHKYYAPRDDAGGLMQGSKGSDKRDDYSSQDAETLGGHCKYRWTAGKNGCCGGRNGSTLGR